MFALWGRVVAVFNPVVIMITGTHTNVEIHPLGSAVILTAYGCDTRLGRLIYPTDVNRSLNVPSGTTSNPFNAPRRA